MQGRVQGGACNDLGVGSEVIRATFLPDEIFFHFCVDGSEMMCITGVKPPGGIVRFFMTPLVLGWLPFPFPDWLWLCARRSCESA